MVDFISPFTFTSGYIRRRVTSWHWVNPRSLNVLCTEVLKLFDWKGITLVILLANPNRSHFTSFPGAEEAEEILSVHNCIKVLLIEQDIPLEVLIN